MIRTLLMYIWLATTASLRCLPKLLHAGLTVLLD